MPITINEADNVATIDEADSFLGKLMDGMLGAVTGDNLTSDEALWAAVGYGVTGLGIGSVFARKNAAAGKKPILGVFL
jgi:hypothetical protein